MRTFYCKHRQENFGGLTRFVVIPFVYPALKLPSVLSWVFELDRSFSLPKSEPRTLIRIIQYILERKTASTGLKTPAINTEPTRILNQCLE